MLSRLNAVLIKLCELLTIVSLGAMSIVVPLEVFQRYFLADMATWSSEFLQYTLVCASMMGGAAGLRKGYQVGITSLSERLGPSGVRVLQGVVYCITLVFCGVMAWYGAVQTIANVDQTSSSMGISMAIPYASLPLGFGTMCTVTLEQLIDLITGKPVPGQDQVVNSAEIEVA